MSRHSAFTLIELLVSVAMTMVVVAVATTAIFGMRSMAKRTQAQITMAAEAMVVHDKMSRSFSSMHPCAAVWLRSTGAQPTQPATVELVFLRSLESRPEVAFGVGASTTYSDLTWTRWQWSASSIGALDGTLRVSEGRVGRQFLLGNTRANWRNLLPMTDMLPTGYPSWSTFVSIPQPRRANMDHCVDSPLSDPATLLDQNRWGTNAPGDIGDYTDLVNSAAPLLLNCTTFSVAIVGLDGTPYAADGSSLQTWSWPGLFVDARTSGVTIAGSTAAFAGTDTRPSVIRVRFTLADPATTATSTFSFSFSTPQFVRN